MVAGLAEKGGETSGRESVRGLFDEPSGDGTGSAVEPVPTGLGTPSATRKIGNDGNKPSTADDLGNNQITDEDMLVKQIALE